ncbi:hypothetical protein ACUXST_000262 [Sphingomonas sp. F9_3S_D5_B_2]
MLKRVGRLFVIKTRTEAWLVIYAIAVGAIERGRHYLEMYPGYGGWMLAVACTGVVFLAGARLLDSVRPPAPTVVAGPFGAEARRRLPLSRSRPRHLPVSRASARFSSRRRD